MSNVKRWEPYLHCDPRILDGVSGDIEANMAEHKAGDYVLFTDYEAAIEAENRRWQDAIYEACKAVAVECGRPTHAIDGGGSDSGDGLDFTLAEIAQAFDILREACADYERLRDALEKTRFISVNERLPELDKIVEVIVPAQKCAWLSHALRYMDDGVWLWSFVTEDHICMNAEHIPDTEDAEWEPTHWRELPDITSYITPAAGSLEEAAPKAARKDKSGDI